MVARHFLRPATFGEYGPYRAAALVDAAQIEIHYAGQQACLECHQDVEDLKAQDVHSDIHCEACHGPGQKHVTSGDAADILKPSGREFCGSCHAMNAAKPKSAVAQVDLNKHNTGKNCIECHNPHQPWEMKK
jgi:nitrate/TMAO reductase-like tetraheme cytochrome c subunit